MKFINFVDLNVNEHDKTLYLKRRKTILHLQDLLTKAPPILELRFGSQAGKRVRLQKQELLIGKIKIKGSKLYPVPF